MFEDRIAPLITHWGVEKFSVIALNRMEHFSKDLNDIEMKELCTLIVDNGDRVPSVPKFREFAEIIRKKRIGGLRSSAEHVFKADCYLCDDVGVLEAMERSTKIKTLILCRCDRGDFWNLPNYTASIQSAFAVGKLQGKDYAPIKTDDGFENALNGQVEIFKERIKIAEQFWSQRGVS